MRIVVFGAGAVGGVIGGRLFQHADAHRHEVTLVARGDHYAAIRDHGLTIHDPTGSVTLAVPVVDRIDAVPLDRSDVVLLTMKTQDTPAALGQLAACAPDGVAVVCAQNGVENERLALRLFADVYGICVMLPATFMEPGVVDAYGSPSNAILDMGRYPAGGDPTVTAVSAALEASGLSSHPDPSIMRAKYRKLLMNLGNSLDALVSDGAASASLAQRARAEGEACLAAAGIDYASREDDRARRDGVLGLREIAGRPRGGGSTWQSFVRGARSTEVDWLNGEIVLLGRLHGVPTPVNAMLQRLTRQAVMEGRPPRSLTTASLEALL
jgi:2-dehydropantoate 2-reductase